MVSDEPFPDRSRPVPVVLTCTNGVSPSHIPLIVASDRPRSTLSTRAHSQNFESGLNLLHEADDDAVIWLESTATAALDCIP